MLFILIFITLFLNLNKLIELFNYYLFFLIKIVIQYIHFFLAIVMCSVLMYFNITDSKTDIFSNQDANVSKDDSRMFDSLQVIYLLYLNQLYFPCFLILKHFSHKTRTMRNH